MAVSEQSQDVFPWLKSLPVAPEFRPTLAEFQDPIAYIFKIEEEASKYGICKILPPLPPPSKKASISNLNRSLAARAAGKVRDGGFGACDYDGGPTFATRQQQIGFCPRKQRPVQRPVWQSGEEYSFGEFEFKAKTFEKNYLKKCGKKSQLSPLEMETLYWRATVDKPFSVEYANDMPGSAFIPLSLAAARRRESGGDAGTVGETAWNMRAMARAEGSLLKFMKEDIPGVTSPMVYIAMMFSWFAWHVEDHDLHSLNYLHMGASKTWYGVPKEAAPAFEEVVRVHGYGGELNPLVTFSTLGEKTTVMSPEVFVKAGIPCCRLVQNPGEFVVTFPGAYHSGFSHGFNFGEASNIATPQWLTMAKDAAIRRAAINYPPMVSHLQLLYDFALALGSRVPTSINAKPRSSRLKDKKRSEGERLTKKLFVENIIRNNELLSSLGKGSPVALLPQSSSDISVCSDLRIGSDLTTNQDNPIQLKSEDFSSDSVMVGLNNGLKDTVSVKEKFTSLCERNRNHLASRENETQGTLPEAERREKGGAVRLSDQRLFSCVTCGVLSFDCVAIIQPKEAAARYIMSADSSFFNDRTAVSESSNLGQAARSHHPQSMEKHDVDYFSNVSVQTGHQRTSTTSQTNAQKDNGSLGLLVSAYGDSSDSEEEDNRGLDASTSEGERKKYDQESAFKGSSFDTDENEVARDGRTSDFNSHSLNGKQNNLSKGDNSSLLDITLPFVPRSDDDPCRLHVFCLEHAAEVEQQLRAIGGIHIMLLCHPEYRRIEAEAKIVAEELAINHEWHDTEFRNVTREDEETIQAALDNVEAKGGNSDWTVKLAINLSYSAILSHSPLYSKQMPYNSVIYNVFGRSSPAISSLSKPEVSGKRFSRQRKYVVGKWCGKVWMSHQVHPFLLEEDLEGEEERSCHLRTAMDEDVTGKRLFPCTVSRDAATMFGRKYCRKRKVRAKAVPRKKLTSFKREDGVSDDTSEDHSYKQQWRASGNEEESYFETGHTASGDSSNQMSDQRKEIVRHKGYNVFESDDEVADRSLGEEYSVRECAVSESSMDNGFQPYREKQSMYDRDDDDDDDMYKHPREIPRSKRTKVFRNPVSYDSEENGVYQQRGRVSRSSKQANRMGGEYDSAENSFEELDFSSTGKRQTRSTAKRKAKTKSVQSPRDAKGRTLQEFASGMKTEELDSFMEGPSTRLRVRKPKPSRGSSESKPKKIGKKRSSNASFARVASEEDVQEDEEAENEEEECTGYQCDMEGCTMSFTSEKQLALHKRNICPVRGCGKSFFSHKYLVQHQRVHSDDRPLKCPWKGCKMTFKWSWSRTEHVRVHTGARPYICAEPGCDQTFRFVSDFSRHKRKTGHSVKKTKKR
ncbi:PREDICTED: lysine-specific demethylase REF6-like isoform X1 [Camelina sativa]|uniref:Lysine-specific demethylase REF6-like isoform X1 n=1 Tax=Camelina sativa TaxID=90675 RepID=A0ABM0TH31_CAMSA|nr:PREDICTED: lysine-specific demethylase REF6-like isoform X2 [Camelina sativa]XP_010426335.2 PREDICTED: lysine-specific demethylase REF6-like isoform X1 [Camelina sativa]